MLICIVGINLENQQRIQQIKASFKQQFYDFRRGIKGPFCAPCVLIPDRAGNQKYFNHPMESRCGIGHCIRCWSKEHSGKDCSWAKKFPTGVCWYCGLPQKLYQEGTHDPHLTPSECEFKDRILPLVWLSYWDLEIRVQWIAELQVQNMTPPQFGKWIEDCASGEAFDETAKVTNAVVLAMWVYNKRIRG